MKSTYATIVIKRKLNDEDSDARKRLLNSNITGYKRNRVAQRRSHVTAQS